jgi:hypothetical protein
MTTRNSKKVSGEKSEVDYLGNGGGILNIAQPYRTPRPVAGIALLLL